MTRCTIRLLVGMLAAAAQLPSTVARIGYLHVTFPPSRPSVQAFEQGLCVKHSRKGATHAKEGTSHECPTGTV